MGGQINIRGFAVGRVLHLLSSFNIFTPTSLERSEVLRRHFPALSIYNRSFISFYQLCLDTSPPTAPEMAEKTVLVREGGESPPSSKTRDSKDGGRIHDANGGVLFRVRHCPSTDLH